MKGAAGWRRSAIERERSPQFRDILAALHCLPVLSCYRPQHSTIFIFSQSGTMKGIFTRIFHTFLGVRLFNWSRNFGFQIFLNRTGWKTSVSLILADFDFIGVLSTILLEEEKNELDLDICKTSWTFEPDSSRYL